LETKNGFWNNYYVAGTSGVYTEIEDLVYLQYDFVLIPDKEQKKLNGGTLSIKIFETQYR
jgi:hypothetical protein